MFEDEKMGEISQLFKHFALGSHVVEHQRDINDHNNLLMDKTSMKENDVKGSLFNKYQVVIWFRCRSRPVKTIVAAIVTEKMSR